jgi:acetoin utilization protein AcuC
MTVHVVYSPRLAEYRLSESHPLRPERFVLAIELMRAWGLICDRAEPGASAGAAGTATAAAQGADLAGPSPAAAPACALLVPPRPITDDDLLRVHDDAYLSAVRAAGANPAMWRGAFGIGPGDTPAFPHMHEISAEIAAATSTALEDVAAGTCQRAFSPAGGLHHAHRAYAAGFCVYNDAAVAIARATALHHGLRVAYVDVDVHHGDGVQEAFYDRADVLTISVHESGRYLFPGTGRPVETGSGVGTGFAINLALSPGAADDSFALAFGSVIAPAVRAFAPDVIVAQLGADTHRADPLSHLATTVEGEYRMASRLVGLAGEVCGGRIVACGGGGYDTFSSVPRAWACAAAALLEVPAPVELPDEWRQLAAEDAQHAGVEAHIPEQTFDEAPAPERVARSGDAFAETERAIMLLRTQHPLLRHHH